MHLHPGGSTRSSRLSGNLSSLVEVCHSLHTSTNVSEGVLLGVRGKTAAQQTRCLQLTLTLATSQASKLSASILALKVSTIT